MKKTLSIVLSIVLSVSLLAGCAGLPVAVKQPSENGEDSVKLLDLEKYSVNKDISARKTGEVTDFFCEKMTVYGRNTSGSNNSGKQFTINNADYVLIYNPLIYSDREDSSISNRYAGDFSSQIALGTNRADELGMDIKVSTLPVFDFPDIEIQEGGRGSGIVETFNVGDESMFIYDPSAAGTQLYYDPFTCLYSGSSCYIWSLYDSISDKYAQMMGEELDNWIYANDSKVFGKARFTEDGGKLNILTYPMESNGLCGYFNPLDGFSSTEMTPEEATYHNTDRAIIHINSNIVYDEGMWDVYATEAHELQHLINFTNTMENCDHVPMCSWLNEAMSSFAEELNYEGANKLCGRKKGFYLSDYYRKGQSLFNFYTGNDPHYGTYGIVHLFEEYLRHYNGDEIFKYLSDYWRTASYDDLTENKAIYDSVSDSFRKEIEDSIVYPEELSSVFSCREDEWMSKLTFNFYMETFTEDLADLSDYYPDDLREYSVYDELSSTDIEGGGRIVIATQDGSYTVPSDASPDLIYVGFNSDFIPVTGPITSYSAEEIGNAPETVSEPVQETTEEEPEITEAEPSGTDVSYTGNSDIDYNEEGYFTFDFNLKPTSYFFYNSSVSESTVDEVASGYESIDGVVTQKVSVYSLTDINLGLKQIVDNRQDVGFVTVFIPRNFTTSEWNSFVELSEDLICKGIFVTLFSYGDPDCFPYPWNIVFSCKDVASSAKEYSNQIGELMYDELIAICVDGKLCPCIYTVE